LNKLSRPAKIACMNTKQILLFTLIFTRALASFAQETPAPEIQKSGNIAFSYGADINMNSAQLFAYGAVLGVDFNLPMRFSTGLFVTASSNGLSNNVIEPSVMARYYLFEKYRFYIQLDLGVSILAEDENINFLFLAGVRSGYRFHIGDIFFIEPFLRAGYPFLAGAGVILGYRH